MRLAAALHRRFQADGVDYVYVTDSAAVLRLDGVSSAVLAAYADPEGVDPAAWEKSIDGRSDRDELRQTLKDMVSMGMVRPVGAAPPPEPKLPPMPYPLATLVLNVTNKCNLSCTYCYEYGEDKIADSTRPDGTPKAAMMDADTAKASVAFLFDSSGGRQDVSITFFGGETLLNFKTIREAVLYAEERAREAGRRVSFSLTTNATLLSDDVIDFLVGHRFGINISIDGDKDAHDRHRTFKSGLGSYEMIVPRIKKLLTRNRERPGSRPIGARVTLTAGVTDVKGLYDHLVGSIGFDEVGFAPVTSAPGNDYALSAENYQQVLDAFTELSEDFVAAATRGENHGFSNLGDVLRELHQGINKAHPCGAGLGLLGVSTEGELGLCHRFVESGDHEVGSIQDGIDEEKRAEFLEQGHIASKVDCHTCFARPLCSGGCYHEAHVRYGDATQANLHYCEWIRSWTDLGLRSYGRIANANPEYFSRFDREDDPAPAEDAGARTLNPQGEAV